MLQKTAPRTRGLLCGLVALSLLCASACRHEYLFAPDALPTVEAGHATITPPGEKQPFTYRIERVTVHKMKPDGSFHTVTPTLDDIQALRRGEAPEGTHAVVFDVDTSPEVWEDYALTGALLGGLLGLGLGLWAGWQLSGDEASFPDQSLRRRLLFSGLLGLGFGTGAGLEGMGLGALIGAIDTQGSTDMRW